MLLNGNYFSQQMTFQHQEYYWLDSFFFSNSNKTSWITLDDNVARNLILSCSACAWEIKERKKEKEKNPPFLKKNDKNIPVPINKSS